jgi:hypothetical protein
MLTKTQRKRLAVEARKLAMECLTNGPMLVNDWCGCAIGLSLKRAGLLPRRWSDRQRLGLEMETLLDPSASMFNAILSGATCERVYYGNPTAVVIPLLAWADELEAADEC